MSQWARVSKRLVSVQVLCLAVGMPVGIAHGTRLSDRYMEQLQVGSGFSLRLGVGEQPRFTSGDEQAQPIQGGLRPAIPALTSPKASFVGWTAEMPLRLGMNPVVLAYGELGILIPETGRVRPHPVLASTLHRLTPESIGGGEPLAAGVELALLRTSVASIGLPGDGAAWRPRENEAG